MIAQASFSLICHIQLDLFDSGHYQKLHKSEDSGPKLAQSYKANISVRSISCQKKINHFLPKLARNLLLYMSLVQNEAI